MLVAVSCTELPPFPHTLQYAIFVGVAGGCVVLVVVGVVVARIAVARLNRAAARAGGVGGGGAGSGAFSGDDTIDLESGDQGSSQLPRGLHPQVCVCVCLCHISRCCTKPVGHLMA